MNDIWTTIHTERAALLEDLEQLEEEGWSTPSLCEGWSVQQVLAHLVTTAEMTPFGFVRGFASSGFNFPRFAAKGVSRASVERPEATLAAFRAAIPRTTSPPGPKESWLGESLVHAEDIRRPLGIRRDYPLDAVARMISFYSGSNTLIGGKDRVSGLTLRATDTDFAHGSGPWVEGPALALLLATTGRPAGLDDLTGPGLDTLRARF